MQYVQQYIHQQSVSVSWAWYLASPVSVALNVQCPEMKVIGRSTQGEQLTADVKE